MSTKKKKKERIKPNPFIYFIYTFGSKIVMYFKNRVDYDRSVFKKRNKKEGCLVLYNHFSNHDHLITTSSLNYARTNYVITKYFYFNKVLAVLLRWVAAISREQFKPDMQSIRKMKRVIDKGGIVALAPAGQISIHGDTPYIDPAIVKLIRLCKCDVYTIQISGTYLSYPKWRRSRRKCQIKSKFVKSFSKEELKQLSDNEVYDRVIRDISIPDRNMQKLEHRYIKGKNLTAGLQSVLYRCPKCDSQYNMVTVGNTMKCGICGNGFEMNHYGNLIGLGNDYIIFENETEWFKWEKRKIAEDIEKQTYHLTNEFYYLRNINKEWVLEEVGEGTLTLTHNRLFYDGTENGVLIHKEFNLETLIQLPFSPARHFEIPDDEAVYKFIPKYNKDIVVQWVQSVEVIRELRENQIKLLQE